MLELEINPIGYNIEAYSRFHTFSGTSGGIMKNKIIALIKSYRAASDKLWNPETGYPTEFCRARAIVYERCADDLEELLKEKS